jgi:hypothetical protein
VHIGAVTRFTWIIGVDNKALSKDGSIFPKQSIVLRNWGRHSDMLAELDPSMSYKNSKRKAKNRGWGKRDDKLSCLRIYSPLLSAIGKIVSGLNINITEI